MRIAIGCDHIVTNIKMVVADFLKEKKHTVIDVGTYDHTRTHYPLYGRQVGKMVVEKKADFGIVICGTGVGITVAANKVPGVRAALVSHVASAVIAKKKYDVNVLGFGGKTLGEFLICDIIEAYIATKYEPEADLQNFVANVAAIETKNVTKILADNLFASYINKWEKGTYNN